MQKYKRQVRSNVFVVLSPALNQVSFACKKQNNLRLSAPAATAPSREINLPYTVFVMPSLGKNHSTIHNEEGTEIRATTRFQQTLSGPKRIIGTISPEARCGSRRRSPPVKGFRGWRRSSSVSFLAIHTCVCVCLRRLSLSGASA